MLPPHPSTSPTPLPSRSLQTPYSSTLAIGAPAAPQAIPGSPSSSLTLTFPSGKFSPRYTHDSLLPVFIQMPPFLRPPPCSPATLFENHRLELSRSSSPSLLYSSSRTWQVSYFVVLIIIPQECKLSSDGDLELFCSLTAVCQSLALCLDAEALSQWEGGGGTSSPQPSSLLTSPCSCPGHLPCG